MKTLCRIPKQSVRHGRESSVFKGDEVVNIGHKCHSLQHAHFKCTIMYSFWSHPVSKCTTGVPGMPCHNNSKSVLDIVVVHQASDPSTLRFRNTHWRCETWKVDGRKIHIDSQIILLLVNAAGVPAGVWWFCGGPTQVFQKSLWPPQSCFCSSCCVICFLISRGTFSVTVAQCQFQLK